MPDARNPALAEPALHCVGRFNLRLPSTFQPTRREQRIYTLRVWSELVATPIELATLWSRAKSEFIQRQPRSAPPKVMGEADLDGVGPTLWVAPASPYPDDRRLLAMRPGRNVTLLLEALATAGREPAAESVVTKVAAGFVPDAPFGFCIEHGAFNLQASKNETAGASFRSAQDILVSVQTETVAAPDDGQASSASAVNAPEIQVLSSKRRQAAGLSGIDERVRISEPGAKARLSMTWIHPGQAASGLKPRVRLMMSGPDEHGAAVHAAWDLLLNSLEQRPASPKQ